MGRAIFAAMVLAASTVQAADIEIQVHNFTFSTGLAQAVMLVKNNTGQAVKDVFIDCAFLGKDKRAVGVGKGHLERIPARGDAYETASLATKSDVQYADCRVRTFSR